MTSKRKKIIGVVGGIAVLLIVIGMVKGKDAAVSELTTAKVERKNLQQSVSETGTVEANVKIEYGWEKSGRVIKIEKKVGDQVKAGDKIASIDGSTERTNLAQSVALLRSAEASLNVKFAGPTNENLRSAQANVDKARAGVTDAQANIIKVSLSSASALETAQRALETATVNLGLSQGGEQSRVVNDAYDNLVNSLKSAVTKLNDGLIQADNILGIDNRFANDDFEELLGKQDGSALDIAKSSYVSARSAVKQSELSVASLNSMTDHSVIDAAARTVISTFGSAQKNLTDVKNVLNATLSGNNLSQAELSVLKTNILTAQVSVNASATDVTHSVQGVTTARSSLNSYQIAYEKAKQDLENTKKQNEVQKSLAEANVISAEALLTQAQAAFDTLVNKPRDIDVAALRAEVSRNQAAVQSAQNELSKTELKALTDGVISKLDTEVGENAVPGTPMVTILSPGMSIKVDISETEISKIKINDVAAITLDAFGEDTKFSGKVISIEPAETRVSGVVYYKTTVVFDMDNDSVKNVKPGMTANVSIYTDRRDGVLVVPGRSVLEKEGKRIVRVVTNAKKGQFEEKEVQVGMKGDNGEVEILAGIDDGAEVVTFIKTK